VKPFGSSADAVVEVVSAGMLENKKVYLPPDTDHY